MFDLAIDSKLRGCDVVKIKMGEITSGDRVRSRAIVIQQKTGRPVQFEMLEAPAAACLHGSTTGEARSKISYFLAGPMIPVTSALGSTLGSLTSG
jgi:hypothetical protein